MPAVSIYALVALVIGLESLGIPLPGEIILISAALLSSQHSGINPVILGACTASVRSSATPSAMPSAARAGAPCWPGWSEFPRHFSEGHVATAERSFQKWGMPAVFFGRFIALLRIFAGLLAGVLKMPYWKFLIANVLAGSSGPGAPPRSSTPWVSSPTG